LSSNDINLLFVNRNLAVLVSIISMLVLVSWIINYVKFMIESFLLLQIRAFWTVETSQFKSIKREFLFSLEHVIFRNIKWLAFNCLKTDWIFHLLLLNQGKKIWEIEQLNFLWTFLKSSLISINCLNLLSLVKSVLFNLILLWGSNPGCPNNVPGNY
jgi:hypothetical protein